MAHGPDISLVQLKILSKFIKKPSLTYSKGRPSDIDNDLYKYHLKFLLSKGYLEKADKKYKLTEFGKSVIQNFDVGGTPYRLFKISVVIYVTRTKNGKKQLLMQKRLRHPYYGDVETISGKILPGEPVEQAAKRKLKEETGISADITFVGVIRKVRRNRQKQIFEDTLYHFCLGENPHGKLVKENKFGKNFWADIAKAKELVRNNTTYGKYTEFIIDKAVKNDRTFFYNFEDIVVNNI